MRKTLATILFLACGPVWAADLEIQGQTSVGPYRLVRLSAKNVPPKAAVLWKVVPVANDPKSPVTVDWGSKKNVHDIAWVAPPGSYTVTLTVGGPGEGGEFTLDAAETTVTITAPGPTPPQPPDPQPLGPTPDPAAPFAGLSGLRVLVVFDRGWLNSASVTQQGAIYSKDVRDYLDAKCPPGPDGKTREWRMYPGDVDVSNESKVWQDAMKYPRAGANWLYVGNGKAGYSGPIPADKDAMLKLLQQYGG